MDYQKTMMEIGICEAILCVKSADSSKLRRSSEDWLPKAEAKEVGIRAKRIATSIFERGWKNVLLLSPELPVLEALGELGFSGKLYLCLSRDFDPDACSRVSKNVPPGLVLECIREGDFPRMFLPATSVIIAFGFGGEDNYFLPSFEQRQLAYYRSFSGPVMLACLASERQGERPLGWVSGTTSEYFNAVID